MSIREASDKDLTRNLNKRGATNANDSSQVKARLSRNEVGNKLIKYKEKTKVKVVYYQCRLHNKERKPTVTDQVKVDSQRTEVKHNTSTTNEGSRQVEDAQH